MSIEFFISVLVISATATSMAVEVIKILLDTLGIGYKTMPLAVITAFFIGIIEMLIYLPNTNSVANLFIYSVCSGAANALAACTGYDTVKALLYAIFNQNNE